MNFSTIKKANWIVATVLLATSGMLATSCSKDKNAPVEQGSEHEGTNLVLSVSGINENNDTVVKQGSTNGKAAKYNVQSFSDVDVATTVDNNVPFVSASGIAVKGYNGSSQVAAAGSNLRAALASGVTYRLYLLSSDGTQVISSQQFTVGGSGTIAVTPGTTYKWVALSYNNQDAIPTITTGNTSLLMPQNKDILYASGNITVPSTPGSNVSLPITFNHAFSRLAIELNSMGVFGPMNSGTVSVTGLTLRTGTINLATGAITPEATTFTPTVNWSSFTNIDPAYSDAKIVYAYTAGTTAINNIGVSVSNLAITHRDNNTARTYGSATPINMTFSVTPELGKSHRLLANIVESTLTSSRNTVKWARSNLYYDPSVDNGHNPYRFYANNTQTATTDGRGYFSFGSAIPRKFVSSTVAKQDPCALIYPQGLWKQPSNTDFAPYTTGNGLLADVLGNLLALVIPAPAPGASGLGTNYMQYTLAASNNGSGNPAFGANSNVLRFYHNGEITNVNVLTDFGSDGLVTLNLGNSYGNETAYWTNVSAVNLLGLAGLGGWGFHGANKSTALGSQFVGALGTAELLANVDLLGLNVVSSTFKNVRCVRAN
ncbi:hypothetical protein AAW12_11745 [Sphingobacterium sp. Ag1]|uniref:hypothetical protein n=1 Tax=Sphingobacterium sp. Ag1 TaxID=1643451 RepID=UPI000627DF62|nr:hypothetical protein [Sphingobacterium sp. Ag1]KKO91186.1 hypothetical protein AAW12_11745 [Sphingobacterium sp. Ag1]